MTKLEKAKEIIGEHFNEANCGLFRNPSLADDDREVLYNENGLTVLICRFWHYFEVFGLSDEEFAELCDYYGMLSDVYKWKNRTIMGDDFKKAMELWNQVMESALIDADTLKCIFDEEESK